MDTHSFFDYRNLKLNNRVAGLWFTENRTVFKKIIETIGKSFALTMRVALRRNIGTETFSFWMVAGGFLLVRLFTSISASMLTEANALCHFFDFLAFQNIETGALNLFSVFFLMACIWYVYKTEIYHPSSEGEPPDVLDRGKSTLFNPVIDDDKSVLRTESFVQSMIAPALFLGIGVCLWYFGIALIGGIYLTTCSTFLMIDETLYHRASVRQFRLMMANENRLKKKRTKYERQRQKGRSRR